MVFCNKDRFYFLTFSLINILDGSVIKNINVKSRNGIVPLIRKAQEQIKEQFVDIVPNTNFGKYPLDTLKLVDETTQGQRTKLENATAQTSDIKDLLSFNLCITISAFNLSCSKLALVISTIFIDSLSRFLQYSQ